MVHPSPAPIAALGASVYAPSAGYRRERCNRVCRRGYVPLIRPLCQGRHATLDLPGANADTTIRSDRPTRLDGTTSTLSVDNSPVQHTLLRFTVAGVGSDVVTGVTLSLYVTNPSPVAGIVYRVGSQSWPESVTWSTAPVAAPSAHHQRCQGHAERLDGVDRGSVGGRRRTYSVRITSSSADGAEYTSREGGATQRPRIVVMTAPPQDVTPPSVSITSPNVVRQSPAPP